MAYRPLHPRIAGIILDSCAFDPKVAPEESASNELFRLSKNGEITLIVAHSTQKEISHPNTPDWVKLEASTKISTLPTHLNPEEENRKKGILEILVGNGKPEKMTQDANHVFEASKNGPYFITTDDRILKKSRALHDFCRVEVMRPSELINLIRERGDV